MCLAIPGKVIEVFEDRGLRMGRVDFGGTVKKACLEQLPEAGVGDYVLVHVGFALARIDEEQARETLELLHRGLELQRELDEMRHGTVA